MARITIGRNDFISPDLEYYCDISWSLSKMGEEIKEKVEEVAERSEEWGCISENYYSIMDDVLSSVGQMNEMIKRWYKYNEDLYNGVMCGARYVDGKKEPAGIDEKYLRLRGYRHKDED